MSERHFRVWRGDASGGEFADYSVDVDQGMVVLDVLLRIQSRQAGDLALRWANDRLVAGGTAGTLRYQVRQASVIETHLEIKTDLGGVFEIQQSERYDARLIVLVELMDAQGVPRAHASVQADRWVTVSEDFTMAEREQIWFQMAEKLVNEMGVELEARMRENMDSYILR